MARKMPMSVEAPGEPNFTVAGGWSGAGASRAGAGAAGAAGIAAGDATAVGAAAGAEVALVGPVACGVEQAASSITAHPIATLTCPICAQRIAIASPPARDRSPLVEPC